MLFYLINNGVWLWLDASSPSYDKAAHARFALQFLRLFEEPWRLSLTRLLEVTQYWPPFFHVSSVLVTLPFGFSVTGVAATNFLFLPVAVASLFGLGRRLFDEWTGAGAVLLTLAYPIVYALARTVLVDFALMTMVLLTLWTILWSDGGLNPRRSWALGLAAGCAMLTKWTAVVFVAGPAVLWLWRALRRDRPARRTVLVAVAAAALVFAAVTLPWYVHSFNAFLRRAGEAFGSDPAQEGDPTGLLESIWWYWGATRAALLMWPLIVPTAAGVAAALVWRRSRPALAFLAAWLVPAAVFFVLIPNKDARYVVPALPGVALLASAGLRALPWPRLRAASWAYVVLAGALQFYAISFGWPARVRYFYTGPPHRADWKVGEIVKALGRLDTPGPVRVGVLANDPDFEPNLFALQAIWRNLPLNIDGVGQRTEPLEEWWRYDAIVSKTGRISPAYAAGARVDLRAELRKRAHDGSGYPAFVLWKTWQLPDRSRAEVYLVRPAAPQSPAQR